MPAALELLNAAIRFRVDALTTLAIAVGGAGAYVALLRRRGAWREFSALGVAAALLIAVAGTQLAEWAQRYLTRTAADLMTVAAMRAVILGSATTATVAILVALTRLGLMRAQLRVHADASRQLRQAKLDADEASRAKSDFLAMMSHEIRTPLNAVMGFANLLAESPLDEAQRGYVSTITTEGARLGSLINDILDLTKIEKGRLLLERLPFAPAETVQEVLRLLNPRASDKKLDLRFEAHLAGPLLVAGDPLRFRQVIVNLVDNAIKFTPRGAVTVYMTWAAPPTSNQPGHLAISVRDTGIGIPADKLKHLFQMFMQADTSTTRRYGGTGLGLAICQRLVGLMGGEITARSTHGEGSEFSFTIPLSALPLPGEPTAPALQQLPFARPPRILVVDDMETNRFLLEVFLRRHGFDPQLAAGGEEAVRCAGSTRYDAILMDLQMPDLDGYSATQRIRAAETPGQHTPIVALTASLAKGTREKCLAAGMDEYLTKPLDLPKFRSVLNQIVSKSTETAALAS